jgi:hypothetical protein
MSQTNEISEPVNHPQEVPGYASRLPHACVLLASSRVFPVATQPGRSGEYAEKFFPAFSITMRNLNKFIPSSGLLYPGVNSP